MRIIEAKHTISSFLISKSGRFLTYRASNRGLDLTTTLDLHTNEVIHETVTVAYCLLEDTLYYCYRNQVIEINLITDKRKVYYTGPNGLLSIFPASDRCVGFDINNYRYIIHPSTKSLEGEYIHTHDSPYGIYKDTIVGTNYDTNKLEFYDIDRLVSVKVETEELIRVAPGMIFGSGIRVAMYIDYIATPDETFVIKFSDTLRKYVIELVHRKGWIETNDMPRRLGIGGNFLVYNTLEKLVVMDLDSIL